MCIRPNIFAKTSHPAITFKNRAVGLYIVVKKRDEGGNIDFWLKYIPLFRFFWGPTSWTESKRSRGKLKSVETRFGIFRTRKIFILKGKFTYQTYGQMVPRWTFYALDSIFSKCYKIRLRPRFSKQTLISWSACCTLSTLKFLKSRQTPFKLEGGWMALPLRKELFLLRLP